ncbi:MAG: TetR/AcrR family transcriptional regulator [Microbacterium sp.]|uniref:TetR/AcrR family transcriptional regulator n=1 Tax=Microbacterium sp. TaxID=51671 RepID=UPI001AD23C89|nr:TetR/AcrR family transcriptional regulator [Microbacterium sp.]MBN9153643.1 TetR/AcrR family transcriptional regulator [Microbacterium sp.]
MTDVRERMADAAALLLARDGYQATSFTDVLETSGAPRGSIYHHFPGGKDELVSLALDRQAARVIGGLDRLEGRTPGEVVDSFARWWRLGLEKSDFAVGCSLVAVTASAGAGALRDEAGTLFERWIVRLASLFEGAGVDAAAAASFAGELLAAVEGAVAIARAQSSFAVFDRVVERLRAEADALGGKGSDD